MRKCVHCHSEYEESASDQKYCDVTCKRAARSGTTREKYDQKRQERERTSSEKRRMIGEQGYGNYVIFADDGGFNRQYLAADGTWTVDRAKAARCLDSSEAFDLAKSYSVTFFGGITFAEPSCDMLYFTCPNDFNNWVNDKSSGVDAANPGLTERFIQADLESAASEHYAQNMLRQARKLMNEGKFKTS